MKSTIALFTLTIVWTLAACGSQAPVDKITTPLAAVDNQMVRPRSMGIGGMMGRHQAIIPEEYQGIVNPVFPDDASLARGHEIYVAQCAACHGDGGMGDGPAGKKLDPPSAPVAHSSQMMADDYLFWRISEGGAAFNSAMPAWREVIDKQGRWDVINYIQTLGQGQMGPRRFRGGAMWNAADKTTLMVYDIRPKKR